jgi:hypothetical protein
VVAFAKEHRPAAPCDFKAIPAEAWRRAFIPFVAGRPDAPMSHPHTQERKG